MVNMIEYLEKNDDTICLIYNLINDPEIPTVNDKYEYRGVKKKTTIRQLIHFAAQYFELDVDSFYLVFNSYQTNSSLKTKSSFKLVEHDDRSLLEIGLVFGKGSVNRFLLYAFGPLNNSDEAVCIIRNMEDLKVYPLQVDKTVTVCQFYYKVLQLCQMDDCNTDNFVLIFNGDDEFLNDINEDDSRLLSDIGVVYRLGVKNVFELFLNIKDSKSSEDHSCKSRLPTQNQGITKSSKVNCLREGLGLSSITKNHTSSPVPIIPKTSSCIQDYHTTERTHIEYRGLVNQSMTCYLNSLLQGLYMTPEFRNALYHWKYNFYDIKKESSKSITFQLQQLFLRLQISSKHCIETLNLTRSFGWDSRVSLRQQDLQELCRIMFDALEKELQNTTHFDLINKLYQGKMLDYVKCLECGIESSKVSTFLDLTLPIRPFGRNEAHKCLIDALNGYIQPEVLEGNNQYACLNCNKKCDAHKGLKFIKFPYILTVHLMRFDFDYVSMSRIKLYDKVEFPQTLNLNSFISDKNCLDHAEIFSEELFGPCNKCDSYKCTETDTSPTPCDENKTKGFNCIQHKNKKLGNSKTEPVGPYIYELYAIMLHSGNATRGHYFAYIKDFKTNQWLCFNDRSVTEITMEDIEKSFGGKMSQEHLESSACAYMLMYRRIDKNQNRNALSPAEFPPHLKNLLDIIAMLDERDEEIRVQQFMFKVPVILTHSMGRRLRKMLFECNKTTTLDHLQNMAIKHFKATQSCQLAILDNKSNMIGSDMVNGMSNFVSEIIKSKPSCSFLLQLVDDESLITPGFILMKLFMINLNDNEENIDLNYPVEIEMEQNKKIRDLSDLLSLKYNLPSETLLHFVIFTEDSSKIFLVDKIMSCSSIYPNYIVVFIQPNFLNQLTLMQKIRNIISRFHYTIQLQFVLPSNDTDFSVIPEDNYWTTSSQNSCSVNVNGENADKSEDNYLTDSDRLTKEDLEMDTSEHEPKKIDGLKILEDNGLCMIGDISDYNTFTHSEKYSFKMITSPLENNGTFNAFVDKRMNVKELQKYLKPHINLPLDFVTLHIYKPGNTLELALPERTLIDLNDFDIIQISFDLLDDQYCVPIYYQLPNNPQDLLTKVFHWVFTEGTSVIDTKKQLIAKLKEAHNIDIPFERLRMRKKKGNILMKCYLNGDIWDENIDLEWDIVIFDLKDRSEYELDDNKRLIMVFHVEDDHGSKPIIKSELEFVVENAFTPAVNIQLAQMISIKLNISEDELELGFTEDLNDICWTTKKTNWSFDLFDINICVTCRGRPKERPFRIISINNCENVR